MRLNRRLLASIDWLLPGLALVITVIGIMTIYSATRPLPGGTHPDYYLKQIYWLALSLAAMIGVMTVDYRVLEKWAYPLFGLSVFLLIVVAITGHTGMGAKRWISLGFMSFQPSELFKVVLLIMLARYLAAYQSIMDMRSILFAFFAYVFFPMLLVLKQPDLGTSVVILALFIAMVMTRGVGKRLVTIILLISFVSVPFIGSIVWDELKPYQKKRIIAYVNPDVDPEGMSYHVQQSKVAVGSGGTLGQGYMKGTQGPFRFLPEKHTDFIFAIFAEEWGFLGSLTLLLLYGALIMRGIGTAMMAKDDFGRFLSLGITYTFVFYCFVNIGMTVGLTPVVGIPLPFMSYGGTALLVNFVCIGLLISIRARSRSDLFY